jgi:EPS-associated MarR family transcriptional regulator
VNGICPCGSLSEHFFKNKNILDNDELRLRTLRLLEANPSISQRQMAKELGVSLGGVNYCLKALAEIGWIKVGNFAKSGHKLGYLYLVTPDGIKEKAKITATFLAKKRNEYDMLRQEIDLLEGELAEGAKATPTVGE